MHGHQSGKRDRRARAATTPRVVTSLAILVLLVLTTFAPTWYTMTHARF